MTYSQSIKIMNAVMKDPFKSNPIIKLTVKLSIIIKMLN
jgi:hypothetical protein